MNTENMMTIKKGSNEIYSTRLLHAPLHNVYEAFANPLHLAKWWGPEGFTNTIHEFDLKPGGNWVLTMHGPEKGNYENASVFNRVEPYSCIGWKRLTQPLFDMEVGFERISDSQTTITFRMIFETEEACDKVRRFVEPKNEENFDRLERQLLDMMNALDTPEQES